MVAEYPFVAQVVLSDASGRGVLGTADYGAAPSLSDVSDKTYFKRAAAGDRDLIFEGPIESKVADQWVIAMARRLEDGSGQFRGVVVASIPVAYLTKLLGTLDLADRGVVSLRTDEGVLVGRYTTDPRAGGVIGSTAMSGAAKTLVREHLLRDHDVFESVSPVDGVARLVAYQKFAARAFRRRGRPADDCSGQVLAPPSHRTRPALPCGDRRGALDRAPVAQVHRAPER